MQQGKELNLRDLEVMHSQEVEHKTYPETMEELDISRDTIARTKKKQAYRDIVIASLEQRGTTPDTFAKNLIALMDATKKISVAGEGLVDVDDNITRFNAVKKHGDILGVDAPKEFDVKHSMGDEELQDAINISVKEMDGNIENKITGVSNTEIITTNTIPKQKSVVVQSTREQATCPRSS